MSLTDPFRLAVTALAGSATLALIVRVCKEGVEVLRNASEIRKNWLEIQIKTRELRKGDALVAVATMEETEKYGAKMSAEFQKAFRSAGSIVVLLALLVTAGGTWAAWRARSAAANARAALVQTAAELDRTQKELEETQAELKDTRKEIGATQTALEEARKELEKLRGSVKPTKARTSKQEIERQVVQGPPEIIIRNNFKDQQIVVDVEGTSSAHFNLGPASESTVPNVVKGGTYSVTVTGAHTTLHTMRPIVAEDNIHYILKIPPVSVTEPEKQ